MVAKHKERLERTLSGIKEKVMGGGQGGEKGEERGR